MRHTVLPILLAAAASAGPVSAGAFAGQTSPVQSEPKAAAPSPPQLGTEAWLRMRGETYRAPRPATQDPAEVAATARLNAEIAARNAAAQTLEARAQVESEDQNARWRAEAAAAETARVQWEADVKAAQAAYERDRAAWEAQTAACRATRACATTPPG